MTEVKHVAAGNICAIVGLKHTRTGDTLMSLADGKRQRQSQKGSKSGTAALCPIAAPEPVFCTAMEAESTTELAGVGILAVAASMHQNFCDWDTFCTALSKALAFLVREDPSLAVSTDDQTAQLLLHGMGELHLEVVHDRCAPGWCCNSGSFIHVFNLSYFCRLVRDFGLVGVTMSPVVCDPSWTLV